MTKILEVNNLTKVYSNGFKALDDFNLEINKGEFFALLGPNGAGKTSLISIMAGPNRLTSGQIKIDGLDISEKREETKFLLGVVPQEISFDSFFTVNEVLLLQSGYYGLKNNQKRIDDILEKLGLSDKKHSNTRALSGGMKRRLLIAKALVHDPKLVVLDEPTAGVDVELRHNLWQYMRELNRDGLSILLTTHYLEEAEGLCKRTAIIDHGKVVAIDETKKLIKSMGEAKKMILNFTKPVKKIPENLQKFNVSVEHETDMVISFEPKQLPELLHNIKDLDAADIDIQGRNLEDVFIKLTYQKDAV
jgi:ABC-2 type transport system ATP-binding protein